MERLGTQQEREARAAWFQALRNLDPKGAEWQLLRRLLQNMNESCRRAGARFFVTSIVMPMEYDDRLLALVGGDRRRDGEDAFRVHRRLESICRAQQIPYIDSLSHFRAIYRETPDRFFWWKEDNHYNPRGHEVMAKVLFRALMRDA